LSVSYTNFPNLVMVKGGQNLSLLAQHAPDASINNLGAALIIGSFLILPSLFYLYYSFQKKEIV
jgi:cytochrome d ubiquinol oxidase subunit II